MTAPVAPIPADPTICRWCRARGIVLQGVFLCPHGCSNTPGFTNRCQQCEREFLTGNVAADLCFTCDEQERAELLATYAEPTVSGVLRESIRDAARARMAGGGDGSATYGTLREQHEAINEHLKAKNARRRGAA